MAHAIEYRRLRAPREAGEALIDPPPGSAAELVAENQRASRSSYANVFMQGMSLAALRDAARQELFATALAYTRHTLGDDAAVAHDAQGTFLLAGHQPELFHPGVWFKNFVLSALGQKLQATAINLIVDNDKAHAPSVRLPTGEFVPFDEPLTERPYEERMVVDEARFAAFPQRVDPAGTHLASGLWKHMRREPNLGQRLAAARHRLEYEHGLRTLEVPLSTACETPSFARFALHLLLNLPRLRDIYNGALADYRRANGVRSEAHPVPPLAQQGNWHEAPLWIWSIDQPQRRPVFVHKTADKLVLSDRQGLNVEVPLAAGQATEESVTAWHTAKSRGIKLRPRALVTTMYARLLLSDLFLHGIGGAKYDQLTDAIIEQFFGLAPPQFMTVTATLKLHAYDAAATARELHHVEHRLRELPYHPETVAGQTDPAFAALREEKRHLVTHRPSEGSCQAWHDAIVAINAKLLAFVGAEQTTLTDYREQLAARLRMETLLGSREFSFCLFNEDLIDQLKQMAQPACR